MEIFVFRMTDGHTGCTAQAFCSARNVRQPLPPVSNTLSTIKAIQQATTVNSVVCIMLSTVREFRSITEHARTYEPRIEPQENINIYFKYLPVSRIILVKYLDTYRVSTATSCS